MINVTKLPIPERANKKPTSSLFHPNNAAIRTIKVKTLVEYLTI